MLFGIFAPFFSKIDIPPELKTSMFLGIIVSILVPVFIIGSGVFLFKYSQKVFEIAFPEEKENETDIEEKLSIALKACGIFLIIKYLPIVLQTITSFITVKTAPPIFEMLNQNQYLYQNAFSSIFSVCLGVYLVKKGELFLKYIK